MNRLFKTNLRYISDLLPPPYSYEIQLYLTAFEDRLEVELIQKYTGREELTIEEIEEEGFSIDEDSEWKGILPLIWVHSLKNQIISSQKEVEMVNELELVTIEVIKEHTIEKMPSKKSWINFTHEVYQAGLETAKIEMPLTIKILDLQGDKNYEQYALTLSFQFLIGEIVSDIETVIKKNQIEWEEGRQIIELIYSGEYNTPSSKIKAPSSIGVWITMEDNYWYDLQKCLETGNSTVKAVDVIKKIKNLIYPK